MKHLCFVLLESIKHTHIRTQHRHTQHHDSPALFHTPSEAVPAVLSHHAQRGGSPDGMRKGLSQQTVQTACNANTAGTMHACVYGQLN